MKLLKILALTSVLMLIPAAALAQPLPIPGGPTLTPTVGIVTALSVLAGVLTQWIQSGTLLGRWITPKAWLPDLTMISTLLGGFLGYVTSQSPVVLNGTSLFYGACAGVLALVAGAAPGAAMHVHSVLPAMRLKAREAAKAAAKAAVVGVVLGMLFGGTGACSAVKTVENVAQVVITDFEEGKQPAQIDADACAALGGSSLDDLICRDVSTVVIDIIDAAILNGTLKGDAKTRALAYKAAHTAALKAPPQVSQ
jgi:hypothetical protein